MVTHSKELRLQRPTPLLPAHSTSSKMSQKVEFIEPGVLKDRLWTKRHHFLGPLLHCFFNFSRKRRKCVISEEYNAKRGSRPSKCDHFSIQKSLIFNVFVRVPPGVHFWRARVPTYTQKCDFGSPWNFHRAENGFLETAIFDEKVDLCASGCLF